MKHRFPLLNICYAGIMQLKTATVYFIMHTEPYELLSHISVVAVPSVTMDDRQLTSFQSSVSLTCTITGQPSPEVKWEHKGNSISTTDAQSNGVITSTHTVSYANAASVLSDHVCHRVDVSTRKVTCTSVAYACRARYKGGAFAGRSAVVIVSLSK